MNVKGIMDGDEARNTNLGVKGECCSSGSVSSIGTISEDSMDSMCSSLSLELNNEEEASSSSSYLSTSSSSSSHDSNGPLYELQELMDHLPIKRGLSMFYQGKTQSFTSLASVQSLEDLPKKGMPYSKRMKSCKSFGGGLDHSPRISPFTPKATISKKTPRGSFVSLHSKRGSFLGGSSRHAPLHKNF